MLHTCLVLPNLKWFKIQMPGRLKLMCLKLCQKARKKRTTLDYNTLGGSIIYYHHRNYFLLWI